MSKLSFEKAINRLDELYLYLEKQEKLLELYRYLNENTNDYDLDLKTVEEIHNKIKELESNGKK